MATSLIQLTTANLEPHFIVTITDYPYQIQTIQTI